MAVGEAREGPAYGGPTLPRVTASESLGAEWAGWAGGRGARSGGRVGIHAARSGASTGCTEGRGAEGRRRNAVSGLISDDVRWKTDGAKNEKRPLFVYDREILHCNHDGDVLGYPVHVFCSSFERFLGLF